MDTTVGAFVRERREARGLSVTELAKRANLPKSTISAIEHGRINLPSADKRRDLARALGVSPVEFLIVAGEIRADELPQEGSVREPFDENDPKREILYLLEKIKMTTEREVILRELLHGMAALDAGIDASSLIQQVSPSN